MNYSRKSGLFALFLIFFVSFSSLAQGELDILPETSEKVKVDTNYIGTFPKKLGIHLMTNMKFNRIQLDNRQTKKEIEYNPSEALKAGFGFYYQWLGLSLTFRLPQSSEHTQQKGETETTDLQLNLFTRKFVLDTYFQRYKSFYLKNYKDYYPNRNIDVDGYPIRPDLRTINLGFNFTWVFNHKKFSYRSAFLFNERQKRNAGTLLAGVFFSGNYNGADSAFIDDQIAQTFGSNSRVEKLNTLSFGATVGYARTFIIKKRFFISLSAQIGPMFNASRLKTRKEDRRNSFDRVGIKYTVRSAVGYQHDEFYAGFTAIEDSFSFKSSEFLYTNQLGAVKFFLGKRFDFNKGLKIFKKKIFS